jgi:hypothetical protein
LYRRETERNDNELQLEKGREREREIKFLINKRILFDADESRRVCDRKRERLTGKERERSKGRMMRCRDEAA